MAGVVVSGLIWGVAGIFPIPTGDLIEEMFLIFVLAGLSAGSMSTLSSYRGAYAAFLLPAILPFAIKIMFREGEVFVAMTSMLALFIVMMSLISARHYRSVTESLRLRFDNEALLNDLAAAGDRQLAINRELEAQIQEKLQTEDALRRAHDDLENKIRERTTQLAQANDVLRTEKDLFRITLASIGDAVITTDADARITYLNAVAERLTGWDNPTARGRPLTEVFRILDEITRQTAEDPVVRLLRGEDGAGPGNRIVLICKDRRELNIDMSVAPIRDSDNVSIGVVLVFRDITEERKLAQQLAHQATHDTLTGLVNRHEFEHRLRHLLDTANPHTPHALLYLDLDQFKVVNDTCGHAAGDDLLRQISGLLRTKLRVRDTLARLGGDEFGVLLEHCALVEAVRIANTLRELLEGFRFGWSDKSFSIGVSIGLVPITQAGETLASVFSAADSSCYAAKEKGRNRVHVYKPDDAVLAQRDGEMRWIPRIQQALADERFRLYYQPIVSLCSNSSDGRHGEILLRMLDETGTTVLPRAFLPAAERYGLMLAIDRWVVRKSMEALADSTQIGGTASFSINISGQSLGAADFLDFVTDQIDATGVSAQQGLLRDHRDLSRIGAFTRPAFHGYLEGTWLPIRAGRFWHWCVFVQLSQNPACRLPQGRRRLCQGCGNRHSGLGHGGSSPSCRQYHGDQDRRGVGGERNDPVETATHRRRLWAGLRVGTPQTPRTRAISDPKETVGVLRNNPSMRALFFISGEPNRKYAPHSPQKLI